MSDKGVVSRADDYAPTFARNDDCGTSVGSVAERSGGGRRAGRTSRVEREVVRLGRLSWVSSRNGSLRSQLERQPPVSRKAPVSHETPRTEARKGATDPLLRLRLAGKTRVVDLQASGCKDVEIRRALVPHADEDDVAVDELSGGEGQELTIADDRARRGTGVRVRGGSNRRRKW